MPVRALYQQNLDCLKSNTFKNVHLHTTVNMVRFAKECMFKAWALTQKLEVRLGPDTADLSLRVGLHSGPVTAGVLRGERSRFQLFGDTVSERA